VTRYINLSGGEDSLDEARVLGFGGRHSMALREADTVSGLLSGALFADLGRYTELQGNSIARKEKPIFPFIFTPRCKTKNFASGDGDVKSLTIVAMPPGLRLLSVGRSTAAIWRFLGKKTPDAATRKRKTFGPICGGEIFPDFRDGRRIASRDGLKGRDQAVHSPRRTQEFLAGAE